MAVDSVFYFVAMGLRSDFISTKSALVLTFGNVSQTLWDGLTHPLGVHAPQLGNLLVCVKEPMNENMRTPPFMITNHGKKCRRNKS